MEGKRKLHGIRGEISPKKKKKKEEETSAKNTQQRQNKVVHAHKSQNGRKKENFMELEERYLPEKSKRTYRSISMPSISHS